MLFGFLVARVVLVHPFRVETVHDRQEAFGRQLHGEVTLAPSCGCRPANMLSISTLSATQNAAPSHDGLLCIPPPDASVATLALISAAIPGGIRPSATARSGMPTVMRHVQACGMSVRVSTKLRSADASCQPPASPFPSSLRMVPNLKIDGEKRPMASAGMATSRAARALSGTRRVKAIPITLPQPVRGPQRAMLAGAPEIGPQRRSRSRWDFFSDSGLLCE